jgi:hypothetical protein
VFIAVRSFRRLLPRRIEPDSGLVMTMCAELPIVGLIISVAAAPE